MARVPRRGNFFKSEKTRPLLIATEIFHSSPPSSPPSKMSSIRNAIPRRAHRERPQPHSRTRKGLLEKRKDYVLRSQDYKRKQATIKRLSEKAAEKNPDEFYFGMMSHRTQQGVPIADRPGSQALGIKEIKPLKMQDAAYLRTMRSIERRRIEKLRNVVPGDPSGNKKILFAENEAEGLSRLPNSVYGLMCCSPETTGEPSAIS